MEDELFGTGDVARLTGMPRSCLLYRIRNRDLPNATHEVARRRVFTRTDLAQIHAILETNPELWPRQRTSRNGK